MSNNESFISNIKPENILENALGQLIAVIIISISGFILVIFRKKLFHLVHKKIYYVIYRKIFLIFSKYKFAIIKIKNGNAIFLVNRKRKKRHIPEPETYKLLAEILDFNTSEFKELPEEVIDKIEEDKKIPSLAKVDIIFSNNLNNQDAKTLLIFIYRRFLHRNPDSSGKNTYIPILEKGGFNGLVRVIEAIKNSDEYKKIR